MWYCGEAGVAAGRRWNSHEFRYISHVAEFVRIPHHILQSTDHFDGLVKRSGRLGNLPYSAGWKTYPT